jgi:hypothetical protein
MVPPVDRADRRAEGAAPAAAAPAVLAGGHLGFARIVALHHRSSTLYGFH